MKRPLGFAALFYTGGLLLGELFHPPLPALFSIALGLAASALLFGRARPFLLWPLLALAGWTNLACHTAVLSPHDLRSLLGDQPALATVRGVLRGTPTETILVRDGRQSCRTHARLDVTAIQRGQDWQAAAGEIVSVSSGALPKSFYAGGKVEVSGVLAPPAGALASGLFDYRAFLQRQEIYYELKTESSNDWRLISSPSHPPLGDRFRAWAKQALALGLPARDEPLQLEYALTLGDKSALTDDAAEPFIQAATYHIFAVDGLRMGILFGIFFGLFRTFRVPRALSGLLLVPLIWCYVALTGWPASAVRAAVMLTVILAGWALRRPPDLLNSLFAAALILLTWDPHHLFQAGFQLSFVVVLCMLLVLPGLNHAVQWLLRGDPLLPDELRPKLQKLLKSPLRWMAGLLAASLAAWLGAIPLVACYFNIVTPVSAPANLAAVPLCALVLISNFLSLLVAGWLPGAAAIFNHAGWFFMSDIVVLSRWFARWPEAYFYVASPGLAGIAFYYALLLAVLTGWVFRTPRRRWKIAGLLLLTLGWAAGWERSHATTRITVLPLNGAGIVFCDPPGRQNDLLVDCGSERSADFVVKPFLRAHGVNGLASLALSCGESAQCGGAVELQRAFPIGQVATSPIRFRSSKYGQILDVLRQNPRRWRTVSRGDHLAAWTVLHPGPADRFARADDSALVLRGTFGGTRVLLLSDLGRQGQNALIGRHEDLRADVVIAGLPAGDDPLCDSLLDAIRPRLIVIVDSQFPATRRPGASLRQRLRRRGVPVAFTRETGALELALSATQCRVFGMNGFSWAMNGQNDFSK